VFHKFVILLNLRSLFWPRLEPPDENSFYQRCVTFLSSAARIYFQQKREHAAAIKYGEQDVARNPHVTGGLKEQSELVKRDPIRAAVFKRDAEKVKLPFTPGNVNETIRGQLYTKAPRLYQWGENARATCQQWNDERIAHSKKQKNKHGQIESNWKNNYSASKPRDQSEPLSMFNLVADYQKRSGVAVQSVSAI